MNTKKLIFLQVLGILLFANICRLLVYFNLFSFTSVIILYTIMGITNIINARHMLMKPIEDISIHDKLTGCYNRVKLDSKIPEYENYKEYAIIFFDLNNFKLVNDRYGHDDGDKVLIKAADQLRFWHKYGDLYRIGGDEFIVVAPNMTRLSLEPPFISWFNNLPNLNEDYDDDFICQFSYGIYYKFKTDQITFDEAMNKADEKMYLMKTASKK